MIGSLGLRVRKSGAEILTRADVSGCREQILERATFFSFQPDPKSREDVGLLGAEAGPPIDLCQHALGLLDQLSILLLLRPNPLQLFLSHAKLFLGVRGVLELSEDTGYEERNLLSHVDGMVTEAL